MRYTRANFIIVIIMLTISGCGSEKVTISYYRHIDFAGIHNIKLRYQFVPDSTKDEYCFKVAFDKPGRITMLKFPNVGACGNDPRDRYQYIRISYTDGHEIYRFYDSDKSRVAVNDGFYGEDYTLNKDGFPAKVTFLDSLDKPMENDCGVAGWPLTVNDKGLVTECLRVNLAGDTITDTGGRYRTRFSFDDDGNLLERANYDSTGALANTSNNTAIWRWKYDSLSNTIEESYIDADGRLCPRDDDNAASLQYAYDSTGALAEVIAFDKYGNYAPSWDLDSCIRKIKRHENGYASEVTYYSNDQVLRKIVKYNFDGNMTEERFFDLSGNPMLDRYKKYAVYIGTYNDDDYIVEENFYDDKMHLTVSKDYGFARAVYNRDENNYLLRLSYYNEKNELFESPKFQFAIATYKYDFHNLVKTETFRDIRGFPKKCSYGYAIKTTYYNRNWKQTGSKFFDENGVEITTVDFDDTGQMAP